MSLATAIAVLLTHVVALKVALRNFMLMLSQFVFVFLGSKESVIQLGECSRSKKLYKQKGNGRKLMKWLTVKKKMNKSKSTKQCKAPVRRNRSIHEVMENRAGSILLFYNLI